MAVFEAQLPKNLWYEGKPSLADGVVRVSACLMELPGHRSAPRCVRDHEQTIATLPPFPEIARDVAREQPLIGAVELHEVPLRLGPFEQSLPR